MEAGKKFKIKYHHSKPLEKFRKIQSRYKKVLEDLQKTGNLQKMRPETVLMHGLGSI
jgi:hypothetical protein